ncbi:hypothetical protein BKA70DRAFT_49509 [Coprinopsis sp. MPI-PUGE-AT-0042]|nr:hypothetical protein BKA70DRAFT_49509 [Coprinopsis sp. MPI-PUGE-AT-0042]
MPSMMLPFFAAGELPTPASHAEDLSSKANEIHSTIKFQLEKVLCLGAAVGHVNMADLANVMLWINFLVSLSRRPGRISGLSTQSPLRATPVRLYSTLRCVWYSSLALGVWL